MTCLPICAAVKGRTPPGSSSNAALPCSFSSAARVSRPHGSPGSAVWYFALTSAVGVALDGASAVNESLSATKLSALILGRVEVLRVDGARGAVALADDVDTAGRRLRLWRARPNLAHFL